MSRNGNAGAFETIVDRYQGRLLGFCRQMLGSTEDAEDVLQEVFVNAYRAMLADDREINLRPWLYRIARNRCLNQLRKPTADAQESMDMVPMVEAASTAEKVHNREEFRQLLTDVGNLPETQRSALMLREMDAMSYEEIAHTMETSVPSVKSLLVRARISLAEASQARLLTCGEVRLELAEAAEGLCKASGPVRRHVRDCEECADFRAQIRSNDKVLAALVPAGPLVALKGFIVSKLGLGGGAGGASTGVGAAGGGAAATATSAGAVGSAAAAISGGGAASGIGAVGGALGTKAVAGVVTAAVLTAGAVEVKQTVAPPAQTPAAAQIRIPVRRGTALSSVLAGQSSAPRATAAPTTAATVPAAPAPAPEAHTDSPATAPAPDAEAAPAGPSTTGGETGDGDKSQSQTPGITDAKPPAGEAGAPAGEETVVVAVGGSPASEPAPPPPAEAAPPPAESPPPPAESDSGGSPSSGSEAPAGP
jgi:RNA polymerase sigma factor (sigma-70 family)